MSLKSTWRNYRIRRHERVLAKLKADCSSLDTGTPEFYDPKYFATMGGPPNTRNPATENSSLLHVAIIEREVARINQRVSDMALKLENLCLQLAGIQQAQARFANTSSFYGHGPVGPELDGVFEATEHADEEQEQHQQPQPGGFHSVLRERNSFNTTCPVYDRFPLKKQVHSGEGFEGKERFPRIISRVSSRVSSYGVDQGYPGDPSY